MILEPGGNDTVVLAVLLGTTFGQETGMIPGQSRLVVCGSRGRHSETGGETMVSVSTRGGGGDNGMVVGVWDQASSPYTLPAAGGGGGHSFLSVFKNGGLSRNGSGVYVP